LAGNDQNILKDKWQPMSLLFKLQIHPSMADWKCVMYKEKRENATRKKV
jgi:hypothetical protein